MMTECSNYTCNVNYFSKKIFFVLLKNKIMPSPKLSDLYICQQNLILLLKPHVSCTDNAASLHCLKPLFFCFFDNLPLLPLMMMGIRVFI